MKLSTWILAFSLLWTATVVTSLPKGQTGSQGRSALLKGLSGDMVKAYDFITDPDNSVFFISFYIFRYLATQIAFITMHLLFWDHSTTRPDEEINLRNQWNFFTNPDTVMENIFITFGHTASLLFYWYAPSLLYSGQPLVEKRSGKAYTPLIQAQANLYENSFRRHFCPNCIVNTTLVNTLVSLALISFWMVSPYFRRRSRGKRNSEITDQDQVQPVSMIDKFSMKSLHLDRIN